MANQGSEMMAGDRSTAQGGEQLSAKDSNEVNKITRPGRYSMRSNRPESSTGRLTPKLCCTGCGNEAHPKGVPCPAWGKNCLRSRKSNHFARACPNRKPNHFGRQVKGENMGLIECHIEQTTKAPSPVMEVEQPERKNLIPEYENVFTGIGKLKGVTVKLHVVPGAPGTIQKQRVSMPLKD